MRRKITVIRRMNPQPDKLDDAISWKGSDWSSPETGYISVVKKCPFKKIDGDKIKTVAVFQENGVFYWGLTC